MRHNNSTEREIVGYIIAIILVTSAWHSEATTVERFSLHRLAKQSERILVVQCLERTYEYADGEPITRYEFAVNEVIKGPADSHITLRLPGGIIGAFESRIAGMPTFSVSSRDILFLTAPNLAGTAWPVGLGQGAFQIRLDADDTPRVYQRLDGLTSHDKALKPTPEIGPVQGSALASFLMRVRSLSKSNDSAQ